MASAGNQHCANCIGTLPCPILTTMVPVCGSTESNTKLSAYKLFDKSADMQRSQKRCVT